MSSKLWFYDYALLMYSGLYRWVSRNSCGSEENHKKIDGITSLCNQGLPGLKPKILAHEYEKLASVTECNFEGEAYFSDEENHIRYPKFKLKIYVPVLDRIIDVIAGTRINPCIFLLDGNSINGKHSKIWVNLLVKTKVNVSSTELVSFYKALEACAAFIERLVAETYVNIIDDATERDQTGTIIIRTASVDHEKEQPNFKESFNDLDAHDKIMRQLSTDENLGLSAREVLLLSTQGRFNGNQPTPPEPKTFAQEIMEEVPSKVWRVGGNSKQRTIYRVSVGEENIGTGGLFYCDDPSNKPEEMYKIFKRLAVNFSWVA